MIMKNETYDGLKNFATMILPAIGTLYFALAEIWGLPNGEKIVGTVTAICTFLGVFIKVSNVKYNKQKEAQESIDGVVSDLQRDALDSLAKDVRGMTENENAVGTGTVDSMTVESNMDKAWETAVKSGITEEELRERLKGYEVEVNGDHSS